MSKIFEHLNEEAPVRMRTICSADNKLYGVDANGVVYQFHPQHEKLPTSALPGYWLALDMTTKPFEIS